MIHFPTSEGVSEQANGRASGPVLLSVFLAVFDNSGVMLLLSILAQIVQNSARLEELIIYGGHQRHPEIDISAFEEVLWAICQFLLS